MCLTSPPKPVLRLPWPAGIVTASRMGGCGRKPKSQLVIFHADSLLLPIKLLAPRCQPVPEPFGKMLEPEG